MLYNYRIKYMVAQMDHVSIEQVRLFRLYAHHLSKRHKKSDAEKAAGACGFQNSPPGAWESALHCRIPDYTLDEMVQMLEAGKTLLQAWSFRGAPVVFPVSKSGAFLSALVPQRSEPWIYTRGIHLALDFLQMPFDELLALLKNVMPKLDAETIKGKNALGQGLAEWMLPFLPSGKRDLWNKPSMYGNPGIQTVGGAIVSFLLRPCAFMGLAVFGKREGASPTFASYKNWIGYPLESGEIPEQKLARKYLHCFAPATEGGLAEWLGCSPAQAKRIWQTVIGEIEPVNLSGKVCYALSSDKGLLLSPPQPERKALLLGGHDPYLGLQDRGAALGNRALQKQIWQAVSNPGAVLRDGEIVGMWKARKKSKALEIEAVLWEGARIPKGDIQDLCDEYALFRQLKLNKAIFLTDRA
jgi:hypothetical protein